MQKLPIAIAVLQFATSAAAAQSQYVASKAELLSVDQETRISQLIMKQAVPLSSGSFSIALHAQVPTKIQVHFFTSEAEQLAPQVRGFGQVIAKGQTALVDQRTHKVEIVFARRGKQQVNSCDQC
jgi:hypothetical protein